jgi:hypothetical protein
MGQKQDLAAITARCGCDHPSPRAIHGPIRLATGSGSFFHISIRREWVALVGSASRGALPGAV